MSIAGRDKYTYTPLASPDDFRLVRVHRGASDHPDEEPLEIAFLAARFDQECSYAALSYAWGTDLGVVDIQIDDLCIDQGNVQEKNHQVRRMAEIYRRATFVVIWLGEPSPDSDLALEFMITMSIKDPHTLAFDREVSESWAAVSNLMRRSWFTRRWVVQEVAFARQAVLRCGTGMVSWTRFCAAVTLFVEKMEDIVSLERPPPTFWSSFKALAPLVIPIVPITLGFGTMLSIGAFAAITAVDFELSRSPFGQLRGVGAHSLIAIYDRVLPHERGDQEPHRLCTMETLLFCLPSFDVTEKRDVVFALTSLAKDYVHFTPDYGQSTIQVYKNAVQQVVESSGYLNILCRPWVQPSANLPSWVSTFSALPFRRDHEGVYFRQHADTLVCSPHQRVHHASGSSHTSATFNNDDARFILTCGGFLLPKIEWKGEAASYGRIRSTWRNSMDETIKKQKPQMHWRTLVADRDSEGNPPPHWYSLAHDETYKLCSGGDLNTEDLLRERKEKEEQISRTLKAFIRRVQAVTWNRRLVRLAGNSLALVPERTALSDNICILFGCDVPVVLRRHGDDFWEFIGEAFVYGAMDGEAMDRPHENMIFNLI
ncbi:HET domain containing protein [Hyaloscypha variabilis]